MAIEMSTERNFGIIQMDTIQLIDTDLLLYLLEDEISTTQVYSASSTMSRIEAKLHGKVRHIRTIKMSNLLKGRSYLTPLSCGIFSKKLHAHQSFFLQDSKEIDQIFLHISHRLIQRKTIHFSYMDIDCVIS